MTSDPFWRAKKPLMKLGDLPVLFEEVSIRVEMEHDSLLCCSTSYEAAPAEELSMNNSGQRPIDRVKANNAPSDTI
jgi:hypothetical protein